ELQRQYPGDAIVLEPSSGTYFDMLQKRFPVRGSKIDWDRVSMARVNRVDTADSEQYLDDAEAFAHDIQESERLYPDYRVVVIGDMPQHTYVLAPDAEWCLAFTLEGDLCFGYALHERS